MSKIRYYQCSSRLVSFLLTAVGHGKVLDVLALLGEFSGVTIETWLEQQQRVLDIESAMGFLEDVLSPR